jgi:predicted TIM-barrel fold metal-dependent hydrolase
MQPNRRDVLKLTGAMVGAVGLEFASGRLPADETSIARTASSESDHGLPKSWRKMRKFDVHNHVMDNVHRPDANWSKVESMIEAAEQLGIDKLCCSRPIVGGAMADIKEVRNVNDSVLAAMKRYPERIAGFCFVQPGNGAAALDEIDRCLDRGMIGVKLYNQFKYSDPIVYPVAERCIEHRIPILGHSAHLTDASTRAAQPKTSDSLDFCWLSERYPELILILGHVNGGGDWEWAIKGLRDCPHVYLDTSGSVLENDTIGKCVRELGHQRVLFATDQTMEGCVGKILSADLTDAQREDIFWRNLQKILDRRKV